MRMKKISSGGGNFALINNKCYRDDYGEQIFSLRTNTEKWICQPNIGPEFCEHYDLARDPTELHPQVISFCDLPAELREYIVQVQRSRAFYKRLWLYLMASKRKTRFKMAISKYGGALLRLLNVRRCGWPNFGKRLTPNCLSFLDACCEMRYERKTRILWPLELQTTQ